MSECEMALLECMPVVSDPGWYSRISALGIGDARDLHFDSVVLLAGGRFEFARHLRDASGNAFALIIPVYDDLSGLTDLAAFNLDTGKLGIWRGRGPMLGAENLYGWRLGDPLVMHETPLDWLKASPEGVFVIDPQRASPLLRQVEPLGVKSAIFGRRMREAMTIRAPRIVVAESRRAAA
jgi:hypothetical protein